MYPLVSQRVKILGFSVLDILSSLVNGQPNYLLKSIYYVYIINVLAIILCQSQHRVASLVESSLSYYYYKIAFRFFYFLLVRFYLILKSLQPLRVHWTVAHVTCIYLGTRIMCYEMWLKSFSRILNRFPKSRNRYRYDNSTCSVQVRNVKVKTVETL